MEESDEIFEDEIDPRIKGELDVLNKSTEDINSLETKLSEERCKFKSALSTAIEELAVLSKKYGKSVDRARPYYTTKGEAAKAHLALQRAVGNFQRANGIHRAAKETIALAESRLREFDDKKVDAAWQEMLSLQTIRFMDAERDRTKSERLHEQAAKRYEFLDKKLHIMSKKHKKSRTKTKPYFQLKENLETELQKKRQKVEELQRSVDAAKQRYKNSLENLERISNEIHEKRNALRGQKKASVVEKLRLRKLASEADGQNEYDSECEKLMHDAELNLNASENYDELAQLECEMSNSALQDHDFGSIGSSSESEDEYDCSSTDADSNTGEIQSMKGRKTVPTDQNEVDGPQLPGSTNGSCETDNATYRRLHGTTLGPGGQLRAAGPTASRNRDSDDFDIFDDLC